MGQDQAPSQAYSGSFQGKQNRRGSGLHDFQAAPDFAWLRWWIGQDHVGRCCGRFGAAIWGQEPVEEGFSGQL